jgi:hypothetical protein
MAVFPGSIATRGARAWDVLNDTRLLAQSVDAHSSEREYDMTTIFSTSTEARVRARKNVRAVAKIIDQEYFSLPRFRVQCFSNFPGYWRALQKHYQVQPFLINYGYESLMTDYELYEQVKEKTAMAFLRGNTICISPRLWHKIAELPPTGVVTSEQWIVVLICAHEIFHLHATPDEGPLHTITYILHQALSDMGAVDVMRVHAPLDHDYFVDRHIELLDRLKDCLDYTAGPDMAGGKEFPRFLATLLLLETNYDPKAAYRRLCETYRDPDGIQMLEESFQRAAEGLSEAFDMGNLIERAFETEPGPLNPVATGLAAVINEYYGREVQARLETDAFLALMGLDTFYHPKNELPSLAELQVQLDALHNAHPKRFSVLERVLGER